MTNNCPYFEKSGHCKLVKGIWCYRKDDTYKTDCNFFKRELQKVVFKVCKQCVHSEDCLINGIPEELNIQARADRLGGIHLPKGCPLREGKKPKEEFVFR